MFSTLRSNVCGSGLLLVLLPTIAGFGQTRDYLSGLAAARQEVNQNEGFAVYVSEPMGADALKALGSPGKKVDEAVVAHRNEGKFVPLDKLFAFTDIGPEERQPTISYPEAASFVKFLIAKYQLEKFRQAYKSLEDSDDTTTIQKNQQTFREIYGKLPSELEPEWLNTLRGEEK